MKYIVSLVLLASCATPPAASPPAAPLEQESRAQTSPDITQPELAALPEEDPNSADVDQEDPNDEYCSEFLEHEGDGPAECIVLEDDEDFAIVMKTTDASKPLSTYWAVYCHGLQVKPINIPAGLPDSLNTLVFERDKDIQIRWSHGTPATSGTMSLPLPVCVK